MSEWSIKDKCAWASCRLRGPISPDTRGNGPWYCTWHWIIKHDRERAGDFQAFVEWCSSLRASGYCTDWTHYPPDFLWALMRGEHPENPGVCSCGVRCAHHTPTNEEIDRGLLALGDFGLRAPAWMRPPPEENT